MNQETVRNVYFPGAEVLDPGATEKYLVMFFCQDDAAGLITYMGKIYCQRTGLYVVGN